MRSGAGGELALAIRLERDDSIPAFGAYLRCEEQHAGSHVILLNVQACMAPTAECEDGSTQEMTREDRLRLIVTSIMHEFGHALESHFRLAVNERHIEQACAAWETAYLSSGGGGAEPVGDTRDKRHEGEPLNDEICGESRAKKL